MPHHVYTTDAFVLESNPSREADKTYILLTKELGKIRASAQAVRLIQSKLRYNLQDLSFVKLSVVRGKEFWRITNASLISHIYEQHKSNKQLVYTLAQIFVLLKRLVPEEEKNEKLFDIIASAVDFIENSEIQKEDIKALENILVLRILNNLGYLGRTEVLVQFIENKWDEELLRSMHPLQKKAVAEINRSMKETHL